MKKTSGRGEGVHGSDQGLAVSGGGGGGGGGSNVGVVGDVVYGECQPRIEGFDKCK